MVYKMNLEKSKEYLERAKKVIPSATQTFSKGPTQWVGDVSPHYLKRGDGAWVWDVDGNRYLDYLMALGPIILGYNNQRVNEAVIQQLQDGAVFSQMHPLEVEVAEMLVDLIPCAEMVRFAKNGSDATTGAVRAARAYTNRERIIYCGYHGWHDWYIGTTTRDLGVPSAVKELTSSFEYNDLSSLEAALKKYPGEVAAVVMEPVGVINPNEGFLEGVRSLCDQHGTLLIFDEIVTGFRVHLGGAQAYYGVTPDLACFGKAMANGLPLSAVVGKKEVMEIFDSIFFSGTFGGETLSLAACKATINEMQEKNTINHLWKVGGEIIDELNKLLEQYDLTNSVKVLGLPVRSVVTFPHKEEKQSLLMRSYFMQECVKRGLLYFCSNVVCASHGKEEVLFTINVFREVVPLFADALHANDFSERLEGSPVEAIFRKA
jgi:glutamate-1-semialdehyde-2,1-aminomutase